MYEAMSDRLRSTKREAESDSEPPPAKVRLQMDWRRIDGQIPALAINPRSSLS